MGDPAARSGPRPVALGDPALASSTDLQVARRLVAASCVPLSGVSRGSEAERRRLAGCTVDFIDTHPDALVRSCAPGHLTGSAFVVDHTAERTLLLHHTKLERWLQPGGHADGEANLAAVALREATEETGLDGLSVVPVPLDVDIHAVAPPGEVPHLHHDVRFLVVTPPGAVARHNHEATAQCWVTEAEMGDMDLDAGLYRLAATGFALARHLHDGGSA